MNTLFDKMYERDRRTDRQTDRQTDTFVHIFQKRHKVTSEQFTYWTRLKYFYLLTYLVGKTGCNALQPIQRGSKISRMNVKSTTHN